MRLGLVLVLALAFGVACTSEEETAERDSSLACDHFRNVMADVSAGILTDAELRDKLKEVEDDAIIATSAVQSASTEMLAAITAADTDRLLVAAGEMDAACTESGN